MELYDLSRIELERVLLSDEYDDELKKKAISLREKVYGKDVYIRGLIEFSNYCKNDCYYCGIRCSNRKADRYRLTEDEIYDCCQRGYELGYRTFVLQSGEDKYYDDDRICSIVERIHSDFKDCAITLSIGEKSRDSYKSYFDAGARRYLLRHETANEEHYNKLHPESMKLENRKRCLFDLKEIGYQVGAGFMVGSPFQTVRNICEDIEFLKLLQPDMIGIGPFISHKDTVFSANHSGSLKLTLRIISILRILFPYALIPATTALGTIDEKGRELGILSGANVIMPNLSPTIVRKKYSLYNNKICTGDEAAECRECLDKKIKAIGYNIVCSIGDVIRS